MSVPCGHVNVHYLGLGLRGLEAKCDDLPWKRKGERVLTVFLIITDGSSG
jgi:hypothetical protein